MARTKWHGILGPVNHDATVRRGAERLLAVLAMVAAVACGDDAAPGPRCGDGVVEPGVECDDGNSAADDACTTACEAARCGDGVVLAGEEACDDGNDADDDACTTACEEARCGAGLVEAGVEDCDDGNVDDTDACTAACQVTSCADGVDDDGDGLVDAADPGCQVAGDENLDPECGDGLDNDGDGAVDDTDYDCGGSLLGATESSPPPVGPCIDAEDNDGDGLVDFPADPDCTAPDDDEAGLLPTACTDGVDNDGDGRVDAADPACAGGGGAEAPDPECGNGLDDDGDDLVDFPDDPDCLAAADPETGLLPVVPVSSATSTVVATPRTGLVADGVDAAAVTVTVRDGAGNPVAGATVTLQATGSGNVFVQPTGVTDGAGVVTGTFASTVAESKRLLAFANPGTGQVRLAMDRPVVFVPAPSTTTNFTDGATITELEVQVPPWGETSPFVAAAVVPVLPGDYAPASQRWELDGAVVQTEVVSRDALDRPRSVEVIGIVSPRGLGTAGSYVAGNSLAYFQNADGSGGIAARPFNAGTSSYRAALLGNWQSPNDGQHLVRFSKNLFALAQQANDPMARDNLAHVATYSIQENTNQPHATTPYVQTESLFKLRSVMANPANAGKGRKGYGRGYAHPQRAAVEWYGLAPPAWRAANVEFFEDLAASWTFAAMPSGTIEWQTTQKIYDNYVGVDSCAPAPLFASTQAIGTNFHALTWWSLANAVLAGRDPAAYAALLAHLDAWAKGFYFSDNFRVATGTGGARGENKAAFALADAAAVNAGTSTPFPDDRFALPATLTGSTVFTAGNPFAGEPSAWPPAATTGTDCLQGAMPRTVGYHASGAEPDQGAYGLAIAARVQAALGTATLDTANVFLRRAQEFGFARATLQGRVDDAVDLKSANGAFNDHALHMAPTIGEMQYVLAP